MIKNKVNIDEVIEFMNKIKLEDKSFKTRFDYLLIVLSIDKNEFIKKSKMSQATIHNYLATGKPSYKSVIDICKTLEISIQTYVKIFPETNFRNLLA